jgi:hypothetical protein
MHAVRVAPLFYFSSLDAPHRRRTFLCHRCCQCVAISVQSSRSSVGGHVMKLLVPGAAVALGASLVAACGTIDLNTLIAIVDANGLPYKITACPRPPAHGKVFADFQQPYQVQAQVRNTWRALPQPLQDNVVIRAALSQAEAIPAKLPSILPGNLQTRIAVDETIVQTLEIPSPVAPLGHGDFYRLANLVSEYAIRQPINSGSTPPDPFTQILVRYYQAYYANQFYTYFGNKFDKPVISLTINDNEITQSVGVFFELIFDIALNSQVWLSADGKTYYPGNSTNEPTVAKLNYQGLKQPVGPLPVQLANGCHMTELKAKVISYVAQQFATAASSDSALTVKSAGGLGISLGVFGKLSLGDNSTLTLLIKSIVSEVTLRLTTLVVYSTLSQVEIITPTVPYVSREREAAQIRDVSALFISPNRQIVNSLH